MKSLVMRHAGCNDGNINRWLENEARRFVETPTDRYDDLYSAYHGQLSESRHHDVPSIGSTGPGAAYEPKNPATPRRESVAFSHASSLQPSPVLAEFAGLTPPQSRRQSDINYDHMPDGMFRGVQENFAGQ